MKDRIDDQEKSAGEHFRCHVILLAVLWTVANAALVVWDIHAEAVLIRATTSTATDATVQKELANRPGSGNGGKTFMFDSESPRVSANGHVAAIVVRHGIIWLLGGLCLFVWMMKCRRAINERNLSEEELARSNAAVRESNQRFEEVVLHASQDGVLLFDGDAFIECNRSAIDMLGYSSREEILMLHPRELSPSRQPDGCCSAKKAMAMIETAFEVGSHRFEWMHRKANGEDFPVDVTLTAVSYKGKRILHCLWRDLTESKRIQARLEALSVAVEQNPATIVITNTKGEIEYVNPKFSEVTGYTPEEAIGQNPRLLKSGEMSDDSYRHLWDTITAGRTWRGEFHNRRKNGELFWESAILSPIIDSNGKTTRFLAIKEDITDVKRSRAALKKSELRYRTLFESSSDAYALLTAEEGFSQANPAALALYGCKTQEEFASLGPADMSPEFQSDGSSSMGKAQEMMALAMKKGTHTFEWTHKRTDGSEFPALVTLMHMDFEGEKCLHATIRDISEQKDAERELVQAQKLESIGQLASGIAHEINTPTQYVGDNLRFLESGIEDLMTLVDQYTQLLEPESSPASWEERNAMITNAIEELDVTFLKEEIPKAIEQALEGVDRVAKIVRSMKEFAHPGGDGKQPANLNRAIESTVTVAKNEWKYVAELDVDFDPTLPLVPCLVSEFNQVILNMIINAVHAIEDVIHEQDGEKGNILISTRHDGNWVEIRIRDTGAGIPGAIREKIFDPFFTTKDVGKGSGQGLAIARATVVKKHGGTLGVESEEGKGTTFIIRIPCEGDSKGLEEREHRQEECCSC